MKAQKYDRLSNEYALAEKVVFLKYALESANKRLNKMGKWGIIPNFSVRWYEGQSHHKKVRDLLDSEL